MQHLSRFILFRPSQNSFVTVPALVLLLTWMIAIPPARAAVIIDHSIQLQSLTITPDSGFATLSSITTYSFGYLANSNSEVMIGPCPIVVTGGSIGCSISTSPLSAMLFGHFDTNYVGSIMGGASTGAYGSIMISGMGSPVLVNFHAVLPYSQVMQSDIDIASSSISFFLYVNGQSIFNYLSEYDITRGQFVSDSGVLDLQGALALSPGYIYEFTLGIGDGARANPEPSTLWLLLGATPVLSLHRFRQRKRLSNDRN